MAAHSTIEAFYHFAAKENTCSDYGIVTLSPWPKDSRPPPDVLALDRMDSVEIHSALSKKELVFGGCTFSTSEEVKFAEKYLPLLSGLGSLCIVVFQLVSPEMLPNRDNVDHHIRISNFVMRLGVDEILFLPQQIPRDFRRKLETANLVWQNNHRRMSSVLETLPCDPLVKELDQLKEHHRRLLWDDIPRTLMPQLKPLDKRLLQTDTNVGDFTWSEKDSADLSRRSAQDRSGKMVTIKTIKKEDIFTPIDLEGLYREYRFLSELLEHPNLYKCIDMLHGEEKIYLVLEGPTYPSLFQLLQTRHGQRLDSRCAIEVFSELSNVLAYIHSKRCAHRNITLHNFLISMNEATCSFACKLCDFETSMTTHQGQRSTAHCGSFPTMAPEMALGDPYIPHLTDCWSAGIVLLEMSGGCGSLESCTRRCFAEEETDIVARAVGDFFSRADSHRAALEQLGTSASEEVCLVLERLLRVDPESRLEISVALK